MTSRILSGRVVSLLPAVALIAGVSQAAANQTVLISVNSAERQANDGATNCLPSRNGRFVAFWTTADNLVAKDSNDNWDIFRRDRVKGKTVLVSAATTGASGNGYHSRPRISPDGGFVAFFSDSTNLTSPPGSGEGLFLRDVAAGTTQRFPKTVDGKPLNSWFDGPHAVSNGGGYVLFDANASNVVPGDTNGLNDVFLFNSRTRKTSRISVGPKDQADGDSGGGAMSTDGRFIAFWSWAGNLVQGDTNGLTDVFVRDRRLGTIERVSIGSNGAQGNDTSTDPAISDDGRFVAFFSDADNLVPGDTDGNQDLFLRDRKAKTTINLTPGDIRPGGSQEVPPVTISADGRFVTLRTDAALVPADTNGRDDAYVYDRIKKAYALISVGVGGQLGNDYTFNPLISADGSAVAFESSSSNLVPRDRNEQGDCFLRLR